MGESAYRSSKQRNKINAVMDAKCNKEGVVTGDNGRKVLAGQRIPPGRISDWQKAWRTFLAWLMEEPWTRSSTKVGGGGGTLGTPSSGFFYLLKILWSVALIISFLSARASVSLIPLNYLHFIA